MKPRQLIAASLMLALVGSLNAQTVVDPAATQAATAPSASPASSEQKGKPDADFEPRILRGDDKLINMPSAYVPVEGSPSGYKFEDAPIQDVVTVFMREVLKVDYILHPPITGSVTLATRGPISPDDALSLLESALQVNGLAMGRDSRGVYHVGKLESLKGVVSNIRVAGNKGGLPPGYGVVIIPLEFIGATEMAAILKPMVQGDAIVRVDTLRNMLVMAGTRNQAEGWMDMVKTFDVNMLKGMSVGVFPLKYASVKEVESALQLLNSGASGGAPGGPAPAAARPSGQSQTIPSGAAGAAANAPPVALSENFPLYGAIRVLPISRINSILVVTPRASYLEEARRWIEKLDKPSDNGAEPQLFIYQVQNGSAQHLATVLSGVFGGMQNNPFQSGGATGATGVAPGMGGAVTGTSGINNPYGGNNTFNQNAGGIGNPYGGAGYGGYGGYGGGNFGSSPGMFGQSMGSGFGSGGLSNLNTRNSANNANRPSISVAASFGSIRVVADALNNSVLIWSTRAEYEKIEATLKRLDIPPTQVLIEASIIEVTLSDELEYGLKWYFQDGNKPGAIPNNRTGTGTVGGEFAADGGFTYQSLNAYGRLQATLNALAKKTNLKVVSSPNLMVLDNHTATIAVGEQQPVSTGQTIYPNGNGNTVTNSVQYKDTGVNLVVTPSVNAGNLVTMQVDQVLTDILNKASPTPSFMQRQVSSKVAVRSGEAIVLGGLIKDTDSNSKTGVPILSQIPLVGSLFGVHGNTNDRTELLVILSPRVVRSDIDIREVSDELRDRMKGLRAVNGFDRGRETPKSSAPPTAPVMPQ